jgi:hypothetical protein
MRQFAIGEEADMRFADTKEKIEELALKKKAVIFDAENTDVAWERAKMIVRQTENRECIALWGSKTIRVKVIQGMPMYDAMFMMKEVK